MNLFLLPKNFSTSCLVSSSVSFLSLNDCIKFVNSSNVLGLDKIEDGEFSSNSPSGAQYAFAIPPYFGGNDSVLT